MSENMSEKLRAYRISRKMTQAELAEKLGCSRCTVTFMEKPGFYQWTDLTVARLLDKIPELKGDNHE